MMTFMYKKRRENKKNVEKYKTRDKNKKRKNVFFTSVVINISRSTGFNVSTLFSKHQPHFEQLV